MFRLSPMTSWALPSVENTITAGTTQTQAGAYQLTREVSRVTVATTSDGVKLPPAKAGACCLVVNDDDSTIKVYPAVGEYIDLAAINTEVTIATTKRRFFVAIADGSWISFLSA